MSKITVTISRLGPNPEPAVCKRPRASPFRLAAESDPGLKALSAAFEAPSRRPAKVPMISATESRSALPPVVASTTSPAVRKVSKTCKIGN